MTNKAELIVHIGLTWEMCGGRELSEKAQEMLAHKLSQYDHELVIIALDRCREECSHGISMAAIIERIPNDRPGAEEAWTLCPQSEDQTVVWTPEIATAWRSCCDEEDSTARRMAFREIYKNQVDNAKAIGLPTRWEVSLGHDPATRARPIVEAVEKGRLDAAWVVEMYPQFEEHYVRHPMFQGIVEVPQLPQSTNHDPDIPTPEEVKQFVSKLAGRLS